MQQPSEIRITVITYTLQMGKLGLWEVNDLTKSSQSKQSTEVMGG